MNWLCLLALSLWCLPYGAFAFQDALLKNYIQEVITHSPQLQSLAQRTRAQELQAEARMFQFDPQGQMSAEMSQAKNPETSPFAPADTSSRSFAAGVSKLWQSGWRSSLDYSLRDEDLSFASRGDVSYMQPSLSLRLEADLFQDLMANRYALVEPATQLQKEQLALQARLQKKRILTKALLDLASLLEARDEKGLTNEVCGKTERQTQNLEKKAGRGSVPQRELLQSRKELNTCRAEVRSITRDMTRRQLELRAEYAVDPTPFLQLTPERLFGEFLKVYRSVGTAGTAPGLKDNTEIKAKQAELAVLESRQQELLAAAEPALKLNVSAGFKGSDDAFGAAHEQTLKASYPFFSVGVATSFPWEQPSKLSEVAQNRMALQALQTDLSQLEALKNADFESLKAGLANDISAYQTYVRNVELSRAIVKEAERDFNNGRIDYNNLTEFQKALVASQRSLGRLRLQIMVSIVEFVDYYGSFASY